MNLISMVLFTAQGRYWRTLLPTLMAHMELFPGYKIKLYVAQDAMAHPLSFVFAKLQAALPERFEYEVVEGDYQNCQPTLWRLRPLWDQDVETFFCRDIDSVPCTEEIQAVRLFLDSQYAVHSVRSFHLHTTLLMAGLCGFKPGQLAAIRQVCTTFDLFVNAYQTATKERPNFEWGCDQEALAYLCGGMRHVILDCPIGNCPPHHPAAGVPTASNMALKDVNLYDLNQDMLAICDEITAIPWGEFKGFAGRPQGDFRAYLPRMLALDLPTGQVVKQIIEQNPALVEYYAPDAKPEDTP